MDQTKTNFVPNFMFQNMMNNQNMFVPNMINMLNNQNMLINPNMINIMNNQNFINNQNLAINNQANIMNKDDKEMNLSNKFNEAEDLFPYIEEPKKLIQFINSDNQKFNVLIPISLTKNDLYSVALKYKFLSFSNIILSYSNCMVKKDNSSIEEIPNNAIINIIEERNIPYNKFKECKDLEKAINVLIKTNSFTKTVILSEDITISELLEGIYSLFGANNKCLQIFYGYGCVLKESNQKLKSICKSNILNLIVDKTGDIKGREKFWKTLRAKVLYKYLGKKEEKILKDYYDIETGTLESTLGLFKEIEHIFKIKKLFYNGKEIKRNEEKSLLSLGIKEDFQLVAEVTDLD